jgi:putative peptidoglycan lipid II flippase
VKILAPAFYALNDARTPMIVSVASIGINLAVASSMVKFAGLGHAGLALSTSAVALFGAAVLLFVLRRRIGGIHGRPLLSTVLRIATAALAMGIACWLCSAALRAWLGLSKWQQFADLVVSIPLGLAVFFLLCRVFSVAELDAAAKVLAARLRPRKIA